MSPEMEVFVLDARRGYLGKHQTRWLRHALAAPGPGVKWRILVSGAPLALAASRHLSNHSPHPPVDPLDRDHDHGHGHGHVQVTLPEAIEHDEVDAAGRPKTSLEVFPLSSLHDHKK